MELPVYKIDGKDSGKKVTVSESVFGIEPSEHTVWLDVKQFLAHQRQGTHKAKERAEVAYSTKKLKKQKGTGGARAGSVKSPLFVGGGRVFGPRPRDYGFKLNQKVKQLARKSVLSQKLKENNLTVLEDFTLEAPKTKDYINILTNLAIANKKSILVLAGDNKNVYLSSRNIPNTRVINVSDVNAYYLLDAERVVLSESAAKKLDEILA